MNPSSLNRQESSSNQAELSSESFLLELVEQPLKDSSFLRRQTVLIVNEDGRNRTESNLELLKTFSVVVGSEHGEDFGEGEVWTTKESGRDGDWDG